jgi:hypothetical protein
MAVLNNESTDESSDVGVNWLGWIFPAARDISGTYFHIGSGTVAYLQWSSNTTNGIDGTWTTLTTSYTNGAGNWRLNIYPLSLTGVKGMRVWLNGSGADPQMAHFFGQPTVAGNRLALWHPTSDIAADGALFDWGDAPQTSTATKTFRVKNLSSTFTANDIAVTMVDSTDSSPSFTDAHTLSADGTTFTASLSSIGNIAPGAISGVLHVRRVWAVNQPLSIRAAMIKAAPTSWS